MAPDELCVGIDDYIITTRGQIFFDFPVEIHFFVVARVIDDLLQGVVTLFAVEGECVAAVFDQGRAVGLYDAHIDFLFACRGHDIAGDGKIYPQPRHFVFVAGFAAALVERLYVDVDGFEAGSLRYLFVELMVVFLQFRGFVRCFAVALQGVVFIGLQLAILPVEGVDGCQVCFDVAAQVVQHLLQGVDGDGVDVLAVA